MASVYSGFMDHMSFFQADVYPRNVQEHLRVTSGKKSAFFVSYLLVFKRYKVERVGFPLYFTNRHRV